MTDNATKWAETLIHLFALAERFEREGQYNLAKLIRVSTDSLCLQETYPLDIPTNKDKLTADIQQTIAGFSHLNIRAELLSDWRRIGELEEFGAAHLY